jgi:hypothetical protein
LLLHGHARSFELGFPRRVLAVARDALLFEADALARVVAVVDVGAEGADDDEECDGGSPSTS